MNNVFAKILGVFYEYSNIEIKKVNKSIRSRLFLALVMLIISPYILLKGMVCFLYDYTIGRIILAKRLNGDQNRVFNYDLGFVAIVKNEGPYIREWIAYHLMRCNENTIFYIYDNESTDGLRDLLDDYIEKGIVKYTFFPGYMMQMKAYEDAIEKYQNECRYMAFIDVDEFLSFDGDDLPSELNAMMKENSNAAGLAINWALFGSSGQESKTDGLVIERFLKRAENDFWGNEHIKTIANPRLIKKFISCHYPLYYLGSWSINAKGKRQRGWQNIPVDFDRIRLNHYFGKSKEEFILKRSRGRAASGGCYVDFERYNEYDRNEVNDNSMLKYVDGVKCLVNSQDSQ